MEALIPCYSSTLMQHGPYTGSTLKRSSFGIGGGGGGVGHLSHYKSAASFPMRVTSSQGEKRSPRVRISCVSEAQKDGGKFRDGQGSTVAVLALAYAAHVLFSNLNYVVSPVIKAIKASFADQVKCIQLHSIPVHIAVALVFSLTLVAAGVFIGYLLAGNPGTGTSALLSIETININKAIWRGNVELLLPQDKASTGPVNHGLSPEELDQILRILNKYYLP